MEARLKQLFDYQRYADNPRLRAVIDDTLRRCSPAVALDDAQLNINAAGDPDLCKLPKEPPDAER